MNEKLVTYSNYSSKLLTGTANITNNINSTINNHKTGDEGETLRSLLLFLSDFVSLVKETTNLFDKSNKNTFSTFSNLIEIPLILDRLIENVHKYQIYTGEIQETLSPTITILGKPQPTPIKYNQGLIPITNILDIKALKQIVSH